MFIPALSFPGLKAGVCRAPGSKAALTDRKHPVFIRSGVHDDRLYLDLCRDDWRVVEITTAGWQVIDSTECPVRFRRYPAMKSLPIPVQDGAIDALRSFVNIRSEDDFVLLVSWMLAAFDLGISDRIGDRFRDRSSRRRPLLISWHP